MRPPVPVNLEWIGRTLLTIQAEMHSMRDENALTRTELGRMARREELPDVLRVLSDRIAAFETVVLARMDRTERSINERIDHLETLLRPAGNA